MTFKEFCEKHKLTARERRLAGVFLIALRLSKAWALFIGEDDDE